MFWIKTKGVRIQMKRDTSGFPWKYIGNFYLSH